MEPTLLKPRAWSVAEPSRLSLRGSVRPAFLLAFPTPDQRRPRAKEITGAARVNSTPFLRSAEDEHRYSDYCSSRGREQGNSTGMTQVIAAELGRRLATDAISVHYAAPVRNNINPMLYEGACPHCGEFFDPGFSTARCVRAAAATREMLVAAAARRIGARDLTSFPSPSPKLRIRRLPAISHSDNSPPDRRQGARFPRNLKLRARNELHLDRSAAGSVGRCPRRSMGKR